ncbi:MAG: TetR/AcrR family transcriptional regulator [Pseudomonadota bacterium]
MARTQAQDYDDKRDRIMHRAATLFARNGFANTSIAQLAQTCGVSKATIYHYYGSKEDILHKVMLEHMDDLLQSARNHLLDDADPKQAFRKLTRLLLKAYAGARNSQRVLLYERDHLPANQRRQVTAKQRELVDIVEQALTAAKGPSPRSRAETMLYFGMINWTPNWFQPKGHLSRDELADLAADLAIGN